MTTEQPTTVLQIRNKQGSSCIINVEPVDAGTSVETYAAMNKANLPQTPTEGLPTMKLLSEETINLNGMPGAKFLIAVSMKDKPNVRNNSILFVVDKSGYAVTLGSTEEEFSQFEPLFRKMYESITPTHPAKDAKKDKPQPH